MKRAFVIAFTLLLAVSLFGCNGQANTSASWAYEFVRWQGESYVTSGNNEIDESKIGKEIGAVTKYSTKEGTYSGNFSNQFKKGTKYYEIKGIDTNEAIAVEKKNGVFIKAVISDKWQEKNLN